MVSFTSTVLLGLAAVGSLAGPVEKRWSNSKCMTGAEAQQVADNYAELIRAYSDELALDSLAVDFTDYSESVQSLINTCPQGKAAKAGPVPLLAAAFESRDAFMLGQSQQPAINFKQLTLEYNCNFVTIRWETTNTAPIPNPRPVVGIILLQVEPAAEGAKYPWIVNTAYSEFDSAAWLQNLEQWGICVLTNSGSPQLPLPSGTVGPPPPASGVPSGAPSGAPSSYASPASASASSTGSSWEASATPSSYASSSSASSSYNNGQWTPSSSASGYASATSSAAGYSATSSAAAGYSASAYSA